MPRALRFVGLSLGWLLAAVLWLVAVFAVVCMGWFMFVGPEEEQGIASIWFMFVALFGSGAFFLTAYLAGYWDRIF